MANDDYYDDEDYEDQPYESGGGFDEFLREQLAHTPWWAISLSIHLFVILIVLPMIECDRKKIVPPIKLKASIEPEPEQPIEEVKKELEETKPVNPDLPNVTDPVDSDHPPSDHNETANEEEFNEAKGRDDAMSDAQQQGKFNNDAIGLGGGAGGTFGGRRGGRLNLAKRGGGGASTENAVLAGLIWLKNHQSPSGKWDADGFQAQCKSNTCSGVGKMNWVDPGLTGLATLAFLGAGHTHQYGQFKDTVKSALQFLMKSQAADGLIGGKEGHYMYNHAICALAMAEAYAMTKSPLIRGSATKAIEWLVKAQNPGMAWRYHERDGDNDVSVSGWAAMALKSAKAAELEVPGITEAFKGCETFIDSVTDDSYYITGYRKRPPRGWQGPTSSRFQAPELGVDTSASHAANHTPTAIAVMCRVFFGASKNDPRLRGGATVLAGMLPVWDTGGGGKLSQVDFYYWYYATLAMFQMGGDYWKQWNKNMKSCLVDHQRNSGDENGSWDPIDAWGFSGGRVYSTAVNVLSLEIYYRYARVFH